MAAIAIAAALIAWLATRNGDGESESPPVEVASRIVTGVELREAAARLGQPIYWAGPMPGKVVELKELGEAGGVQILYLPAGTEAGEGSPRSLTVGSYPMPDPTGALEGFAKRPGAVIGRAADGRQVVASEQSPTSVYFASPDNSVQVEVYSLSLRRAMSLARSDTVQPAS